MHKVNMQAIATNTLSAFMRHARLLILWITVWTAMDGFSQDQKSSPGEFAVLFGLNQPLLLGGFNVEANYFTRRMVFDYSHGASLEIRGNMVTDEMKAQRLVAHLPYSTGFGIGYRFSSFLNLRVEPKWHRFELYYEDEDQSGENRVGSYNTFTLGLGLYGKWMPFDKKTGWVRNLMIAPSVRYWPNISTSLDNDALVYQNKYTNREETHEALKIGVGNTPWVVNISVGYRF